MRKAVVHSIIFSWLLYASGSHDATGSNIGDFGAQDLSRCAGGNSMLPEIVAWNRDGQRFHVPVWQLPDDHVFFFISGMAIDADGAPNAYHPDNNGLDDLTNAGRPGHWNGIITDREGTPLIQQDRDPFPGYYISCTSLEDETKKFNDPSRYVDASRIPYVVLPEDVAEHWGAQLGDLAVVMNLRNRKTSFAIYADIGAIGEGSVALADALGVPSNARYGGASDGILYVLFPGSGNLRPRPIDDIRRKGEKLLSNWSGAKTFFACTNDKVARRNAEF